MRILYTTTSYLPATGGAQQHIHELARRFAPSHEVEILRQWNKNRQDWLLGSTIKAPKLSNEIVDGVKVKGIDFSQFDRLKMAPYLPLYYGAPHLFSLPLSQIFLEKLKITGSHFKPEIIHHGRIGRENLALASYKLAQDLKIPFVMTPFHHPRWTGWRYKLYIDLYKKAQHLFALTESEKEILTGLGVKERNISVIGHGPTVLETADGRRFRRKYKLDNYPVILFLGQKYNYKGFAQLIQSAPRVWEEFPETHFVFIGPRTTESKKIFSKIKDLRILELDAVKIEEKCDALAACTIFALPSTQESFGGVFVEAWMYKKPVIGGQIPAIASVIDHGQNGLLTDQSVTEISNNIIHLLSQPDVAQKYGQTGYQKALQNYTWESITEKVMKTYSSLIR